MSVLGSVLIDGEPFAPEDATISVFDIGFQRGYGCFEAMRAYDGEIFRLDAHIDRLGRSAAKLHLPSPDAGAISSWCRSTAREAGDSVVRTFISGGTDAKRPGTNSRVVVFAESVPVMPDELSLQTRVAPWHTDGEWFELTGAKGLSYGFNLAASIVAVEEGFDDALLTGTTGHVLEGPTFSIGWVTDDVFHTPSTAIGILESITRRAVIEAAGRTGIAVHEGVYGVGDVLVADEVIAMSTVREVRPVGRVDDRTYPVGPVTRRLREAFAALVTEELGR